jgi:hypothetical protein
MIQVNSIKCKCLEQFARLKIASLVAYEAKALYNVLAMISQVFAKRLSAVFGLVLLLLLPSTKVFSQAVPTSTSYSTREYYFGTGGDTGLTSSQYKARAATGALGVGNTSGTAYAANTGTITPQYEYIEFVVNASTVNLGQQSTGSATTGFATFYVKAYVASGYVVRNASAPLSIPSHTMAAPSSAVASAPGTEQFGINLVANTSPATFGAVPAQVPSGSFSFGAAAAGYNTANVYKYVNGDVIAQSTKSSGETDYTISYILNISSITPTGTYNMNHVMVATGTY